MKLVGASNIYVRGPLVVSGIMYGIVSGLITLIVMAAFAYWSDMVILRFAGVQVASDFELVVNILSRYFIQNFPQIFSIIMGAVALSQIKKDPATYGGKPLAIIGVSVSSFYLVMVVLFILIWGFSFLLHGLK